MLDNREEKFIEEIEEYYLSVITRYLGADPQGLVQNLENHNRSWDQWYPKLKSKKNFFDAGAERVVYMLLNRGDILGEPSSNPLGSDNSFLKYDRHFEKHLAINIDVKAIKANTNFNDFIGNSPIGENQNSYKQDIEYFKKKILVELRGYEPGLETNYSIEGFDYINITYSIIILYCELPTDTETPKEQRVIAIITNCIPNGKLYNVYNNKVFSPGKSPGLRVKEGQKIDIGAGKTITTDGSETIEKIKKDHFLTYERYCKLNGMNKIQWHVDARFNYKNIKFSTLENERQSRVKKIYLEQDLYNEFFYYVKENKKQIKPANRWKKTVDNFEFIKSLKFF